jgi:hypothetical protein
VLFFTYRFDFRWFHNEVLSFIRKNSIQNAELNIFATRFGDEMYAGESADFGDLYSLSEWARWRGRLTLRYLPKDPHLFHNKFVLIELENRPGIHIGLGSCNLTSSGWSRSVETWAWDVGKALPACAEFLRYITKSSEIEGEVLSSWLKKIRSQTAAKPSIGWLFGPKKAVRTKAFRALTKGMQGSPTVLRIVSPYFDLNSSDLLEELLHIIGQNLGNPRKIEIWVDGSARLARRSDYAALAMLVRNISREIELRTISRIVRRDEPRTQPALHAKIIELEDRIGKINRILGSANFTGAAWIRDYNIESIFLEESKQSFERALPEELRTTQLTMKDLDKLMQMAEESEDKAGKQTHWIYWATLDESNQPPVLTVSYESRDAPRAIALEGRFDPRHEELSQETINAIVGGFVDLKNWRICKKTESILQMQLKIHLQIPEYARITLTFSDGSRVGSPIEISRPNFSLRDTNTGIPLEASLDNLLGSSRTTVVQPIPKRSTVETTEGDESTGDEEDVIETVAPPESLADDPDFNHQPLAVKFAKRLARAQSTPEMMKSLEQGIAAFANRLEKPGEAILIKAAQRILHKRR